MPDEEIVAAVTPFSAFQTGWSRYSQRVWLTAAREIRAAHEKQLLTQHLLSWRLPKELGRTKSLRGRESGKVKKEEPSPGRQTLVGQPRRAAGFFSHWNHKTVPRSNRAIIALIRRAPNARMMYKNVQK